MKYSALRVLPLRRLFSTFATGWPGAGLLIMRLVAGSSLIANGLMGLWSGPPAQLFIPDAMGIVAGILLVVGLWMPIAGSIVAVLGVWKSMTQPGDPWANIFLATIGIALALLGPGEWSVDARLFGWKRIDVRRKKNSSANRREQ
jgi:uncharacterized membrane protein YphA (DoxX/SURF4 family)